eukprot:GDKK01036277.1.p1 GENE.GDKK01036277.1~~GDKK01036277.1.p1  ORF type:complete len:495 (+),score=108.74 GDKK01036277.1:35-1519(+)
MQKVLNAISQPIVRYRLNNDKSAVLECVPIANEISAEVDTPKNYFEATYLCGVMNGDRQVLHNFFRYDNGIEFQTDKALDEFGLGFSQLSVSVDPTSDILTLRGYVNRIPSFTLSGDLLTKPIETDALVGFYNDGESRFIPFPLKVSPPKESSICYAMNSESVISRNGLNFKLKTSDVSQAIRAARKEADERIKPENRNAWATYKPVEKEIADLTIRVSCSKPIEHALLYALSNQSANENALTRVYSENSLTYVTKNAIKKLDEKTFMSAEDQKAGTVTKRSNYLISAKVSVALQSGEISADSSIHEDLLPTSIRVRMPFTFKNPTVYHASVQTEFIQGSKVYRGHYEVTPEVSRSFCKLAGVEKCYKFDTHAIKQKVSSACGLSSSDVKMNFFSDCKENDVKSEAVGRCVSPSFSSTWNANNSIQAYSGLQGQNDQKAISVWVPIDSTISFDQSVGFIQEEDEIAAALSLEELVLEEPSLLKMKNQNILDDRI